MKNEVFNKLKGGLIISCQALAHEPLHSPFIMAKMALAAKQAGAAGIRANTVVDITAIKQEVDLPIIGIIKEQYGDNPVYITPTETEVDALIKLGVAIIAIDATKRPRPDKKTLEEMFSVVRKKYPTQIFMADCSTFEEGEFAKQIGFDCIGTTLAGYTEYTKGMELPALDLIKKLSSELELPIIAEGQIHTPEQLRKALDNGAWTAVVGGAITRPVEIAQRFIAVL